MVRCHRVAALLALWLLVALPAFAVSLVPTSRRDGGDRNPGDGVCASNIDGYCTLRAAIDEANALPGPDLITVPAGLYRLNRLLGPLVINTEMEIRGGGASTTRIAGNQPYGLLIGSPAFRVDSPGVARISNVGIRKNGVASGCGGAIYVAPGASLDLITSTIARSSSTGDGAAICNEGTLYVYSVSLTSNKANGAGAGIYNSGDAIVRSTMMRRNFAASGAGIFNAGGTLVVDASTFVRNRAGEGAGLYLQGGSVDLVNTTIGQNNAIGRGGALVNSGLASVTLGNVTIQRNKAPVAGGIAGTGTSIVNTILNQSQMPLDPNAHNNCESPASVVSLGHNLDSGTSCGLAAAGDLSGTDAALGPLRYYGGATLIKMNALLAGSAAINSGDDLSCPNSDQRGFARPVGTCDIGAYEAQ